MDEDVIAVASERPALQTAFGVRYKNVHEVPPGHTMVIRTNGEVEFQPFTDPAPRKSCSFENIYFSRGNDRKIYLERKRLGEQLAKPIMEMVNYDFDNTVFAFIPNTAETAFYGLVEGLEKELNEVKKKKFLIWGQAQMRHHWIKSCLQGCEPRSWWSKMQRSEPLSLTIRAGAT